MAQVVVAERSSGAGAAIKDVDSHRVALIVTRLVRNKSHHDSTCLWLLAPHAWVIRPVFPRREKGAKVLLNSKKEMVGEPGFEPGTSCSQRRFATKALRCLFI